MNHLFLINPAAGSRDRSKETAAEIRALCEKQGLSYEMDITQAPGDCTRRVRQAAETGEPYRIYVCGGDGTLNEAVNGAAGFPNVALTVYAGGSGNDFVRIFSEPAAFREISRLLDTEEAIFDCIDVNGRLSLNICSVGLDARIGTDVARYKRLPFLHGFRAYACSVLVNVLRGIHEPYRISVNGQELDGSFTMICVCNGRYYGGGFCPVPEANPTDGTLNVLIVDKISRLQVPGLIGRYKDGKYQEIPKLIHPYETKSLHISCEKPTPLSLDGELLWGQEIDIAVSEKKVCFFYPKGLTF